MVSLGVSGQQTQAIMYSVAKQKVPSVWHRDCPISKGNHNGKEYDKEDE